MLKSISIGDFKLLVPINEEWQTLIERVYSGKSKKILRYAIKKEPAIFYEEKRKSYVTSLDSNYEIKLFDSKIFKLAQSESWSADLCAQFKDYQE